VQHRTDNLSYATVVFPVQERGWSKRFINHKLKRITVEPAHATVRRQEPMSEKANSDTDRDMAARPMRRLRDGSWQITMDDLALKSAYQPIFAIRDGLLRPVACEGLLRIFRGETRLLPGPFFAHLGDNIRDELETETRTLHLRNGAQLDPEMRKLFINIDPSAIGAHSAFERDLNSMARETRRADLSPADIVCEITEQAENEHGALKDFVYALRARGYIVAIDDFGARYSNAARVAALTPDVVKIDGRVVQKMMTSPRGLAALTDMVHTFRGDGIRVVLEGLQKSWQIGFALKTGADFLQGFALAVPRLAPAQFPEWSDERVEAKSVYP